MIIKQGLDSIEYADRYIYIDNLIWKIKANKFKIIFALLILIIIIIVITIEIKDYYLVDKMYRTVIELLQV